MKKLRIVLLTSLWLGLCLLGVVQPASAQPPPTLGACDEFAYSTEEDFVTQGPLPSDGNPVISDGDVLSHHGVVCMRNRELLAKWEVRPDLGLDALDILFGAPPIVVFSTELDDPKGRFKAGDLLTTGGAVIPNQALTRKFQIAHDVGLDGLHLVGDPESIYSFLKAAEAISRSDWLTSTDLQAFLLRYKIDIWFSIEGTVTFAAVMPVLDGDLLSAREGIKVLDQAMILPATVPAGLPARGVDFGLDGVTGSRDMERTSIRFSTEILFRKEPSFTDGDVMRAITGAVEVNNQNLIAPFEPYARFLGLDALYMYITDTSADNLDQGPSRIYLPAMPVGGGDSQ
jgi:hypothetical protein